MLFNPGDIAEKIAHGHDADDPERAAEYIKESELGAGHVCHATHKRRKSACERHKARGHQSDATITFVKSMCLVKRGFIEKARVFPLKHPRAEITPYGVVGLVAQNCRRQQQGHHDAVVHQTHPTHGAHYKQQ